MKTYFGSTNLDTNYPVRAVVAIGNFDGVHLGHQEILKRAFAHAKQLACPVVCFTFNPHPTFELRPESLLKLLMTYEEKRKTLAGFGVPFCVEEKFDPDFAHTTAPKFFHEILKSRLHAEAIVVGGNFAFGKAREGTIDVLARFCQETHTALDIVPAFLVNEAPVSSSRIRQALSSGELELAEQL
ncbi:MAG: FAD synthetase family protein, partial [Bdellovibrionales bacterium]|nr:FAD synthetase family protein [Oligoflexia bacterium]